MLGYLAPSMQEQINTIQANLNTHISNSNSIITSYSNEIATIKDNLSTAGEWIEWLYENKPNKFYDYKVINELPYNSNLNNCLTAGTYGITSNAAASTMSNLPVSGNAGTLYVINCLGSADAMTKTGYEYFIQIFIGYTAFMHIRQIHCNNSSITYGSWKQIV